MERAAVAIEFAAEGIVFIRGNHLSDGFVAVVEGFGELVILVTHICLVFIDVFAENIPVVGVGNDVGIFLRAFRENPFLLRAVWLIFAAEL